MTSNQRIASRYLHAHKTIDQDEVLVVLKRIDKGLYQVQISVYLPLEHFLNSAKRIAEEWDPMAFRMDLSTWRNLHMEMSETLESGRFAVEGLSRAVQQLESVQEKIGNFLGIRKPWVVYTERNDNGFLNMHCTSTTRAQVPTRLFSTEMINTDRPTLDQIVETIDKIQGTRVVIQGS